MTVADRRLRLLGIVTVAFCAVHAVEILIRADYPALLWMCNLAGPILAAGCFARRPALIAVPLLWMVWGTVLWALDLASGGELYPTAVLSHAGVVVVGVAAIRITGWARGSWWKAAVLQWVFYFVARLFTDPADNVNLAFSVWPGWRGLFPSHAVYLGVVWVASAALYGALDLAFRRMTMPRAGAVSCAG